MSTTETDIYKNIIDENEELIQYGSWSYDHGKNELLWSRGMYKLLGIDDVETPLVVNHLWYENTILHPEDRQYIYEEIGRAVQQKTSFSMQARLKHTNGKYIICLISGKCYYDETGLLTRIVAINRNITHEHQNIQKLEIQNQGQKLREKFLRYGTWEVTLEDMSVWWSAGMYLLYGYEDEAELPAINMDFYNSHLEQEDLLKVKDVFLPELEKNGNYEWRYSIITKAGIKRRLMSSGHYYYDSTGKPLKIFGITKDVTEEEQLALDLQSKVEELNRSNKELEEFAYVASHDLQEPLRKLTSFSERLRMKFDESLDKEADLYISRIIASAQNMRNLIESLLDFSRLSQAERKFEPIDLNKLIRKLIEDFETQINETDASVVYSHLPTLQGLPLQMDQLFCNLLGNALKFHSKERRCVIEISSYLLSGTEVQQYQLPAKGQYWLIRVADNGIGFEQEYANKIFTIFQRLHGKVEYPGSGVGLSICRKITDIHNGRILAQGIPGKGAVFTIILPQDQSSS